MAEKILTLALVHQADHILLGMKKRGFGAGKWNGFGGKVEANESIEEAAARECWEEAQISPVEMSRRGLLRFVFADGTPDHLAHIFFVTAFSGQPRETEEMRPRWFAVSDIPYEHMWEDDQYWLPLLLERKTFEGQFRFDSNEHIVDKQLHVTDRAFMEV